ncbi:MAG: hypothetical protein Q4F24_17315 [Eubacteriales bacterium]|nr:hypothetical protein [Eubacteriales bacterium]
MYKVEFEFKTNKADPETLEKVYAKTDEIFEQEELTCSDKTPGRRVYQGKGQKQDYGRFWAAFFALKDMADISEYVKACFWYNGNQKENLLTGFLRN